MNKIDILIHNNNGELLDVRREFNSMNELNAFMTDSSKMHELWCQAEEKGKEDGLLEEEVFESKEEYELSLNGDNPQADR